MDKSKEKLMAYVQVPENDSLLEHAYSSSGTESVHVQTGRRATHNWHRQRVHLLGAHLLNLILFATVAWLYFQPTDLYHQLSVFSPGNAVLDYRPTVFLDNINQTSIYQVPPSDKLDQMWSDLYNDAGFTLINREDAARLPNQTVHLTGDVSHLTVQPAGEKALVQFEVFHQLHCLNTVRKSTFPERYPDHAIYPNGTENEWMRVHIDHCIDRLRQQLMCSANVGTIFWHWREDKRQWRLNMGTTTTCANFDNVRSWALERSIDGNLLPLDVFVGRPG